MARTSKQLIPAHVGMNWHRDAITRIANAKTLSDVVCACRPSNTVRTYNMERAKRILSGLSK